VSHLKFLDTEGWNETVSVMGTQKY
jgi:hypothetical protein